MWFTAEVELGDQPNFTETSRTGADLSSLGMDGRGVVRSASECKDEYIDTGTTYEPYKCPFCEVPYEDRCIVTECVKAPHFKLPVGVSHRNGCNGEATTDAAGNPVATKQPQRKVVGDIDLPEALVPRRKSTSIRKTGDDGSGPPPDLVEIVRRREAVAADKTLSSNYTTSLLREVVHAFKRLRKHAREQALLAGLAQGTPDYNAHYRSTINRPVLKLYEHRVTYGNAFQGHKVAPWHEPRIYEGAGRARHQGGCIVLTDANQWPKSRANKTDLTTMEVIIRITLPANAPTSHRRALDDLADIATSGQVIEWHAYGLPILTASGGFQLTVASLDDLYWVGQHQR